MNNLIRGEFYKLRKRKYFIGMLVLWGVFALIFSSCILNDAYMRPNYVQELSGINVMVRFLETQVLSYILYAVLAGVFIAKDMEDSTLFNSFIYGYSRIEVIFSKIIVYILVSLIYEIITIVIMGTIFSAMYGFVNTADINIPAFLLRIIFIGFLSCISTLLISATTAVVTKNTIMTFVSPIIVFFTMFIFVNTIHTSFARLLEWLLPYVSIEWALAPFAPIGEVYRGIASCVIMIIITSTIIFKHLEKSDLK
ncbi:ABC transporter permease [Clostridium beijerinckii]|uniref:ABC transporter permease n=1 Tax=Clostridium beijerinckii TaxID=1520 RepID=UPI0022E1564C|nr:ABC transporter permease [Clostridium beijerinckii]